MNHDVFISYSSKEKSVADGVCHFLESNGVKCWIAPRDIPASSDYGDLIDEAIKSCRVVVLVYSQYSFLSKWVKGEINVAFDEGKPIAPFRIDETAVKGAFRVMLQQLHWIDAFPSYSDRLPDLLQSICGIIGRDVPEQIAGIQQEEKVQTTIADEQLGEEKQAVEAKEYFLKVRCNLDCRLFIDGEERETVKAGSITKLPLHQGEYVVQVTSLDGLDTIEQEFVMPAADKLLRFDLMALQKERLAVEQQLKDEADRKAKEEANRKAKEEADRKAKEEADRKAKEEADRKAKEEADRKAKEEADRKAKEEADRKAKEETERKAKEEADRKAKEEADCKAKAVTADKGSAKGKTKEKEDDKYIVVGTGKNVLEEEDVPRNATHVRIADGMKKIDISAFIDCKSLVSVIIPKSVTSIDDFAFQGCRSLASVVIPQGVTSIGEGVFCFCESLTSVVIPQGVTIIKDDSFEYCKSLTSVVIPEGVVNIGESAFFGCYSLKTVVIPKSVEKIGQGAFCLCRELKSVHLLNPDSKYRKRGGLIFNNPTFDDHTEIIKGKM